MFLRDERKTEKDDALDLLTFDLTLGCVSYTVDFCGVVIEPVRYLTTNHLRPAFTTSSHKTEERCLTYSLREVQGQLGQAFEHHCYMLISFPRMGLLPLQYPCIVFGVSDPGSSHCGAGNSPGNPAMQLETSLTDTDADAERTAMIVRRHKVSYFTS